MFQILLISFVTLTISSPLYAMRALLYNNITIIDANNLKQTQSLVFLLPVTHEFQQIRGNKLKNDDLVFVKSRMRQRLTEAVDGINDLTEDRLGEFHVDGHYLALMGGFMPYSFFVTATVDGLDRKVGKLMKRAKKNVGPSKIIERLKYSSLPFISSILLMKSFETVLLKEFHPKDRQRMREILYWNSSHGEYANYQNTLDEHPYNDHAILCRNLLRCGESDCIVRRLLLSTPRKTRAAAIGMSHLAYYSLDPGHESWYDKFLIKFFNITNQIYNANLPWRSYKPDPSVSEAEARARFLRRAASADFFLKASGKAYDYGYHIESRQIRPDSNILVGWCVKGKSFGITDRQMRIFIEAIMIVLVGMATVACYFWWRRVSLEARNLEE